MTAGTLAQVLEHTHRLQQLVAAGDWTAAAQVESARRGLLAGLFATAPPAVELPEVIARLRELIAANERLIGLADGLRREAAREARQATTGRRAVQAYAAQAG